MPVAQVIAAQRLPPSTVSFVILDPDTGRVVRSQNPDTPRSPASTIKVVTTFAALELLGPAYTWHTRASTRGALNDGVLDGDLILQGGGDPYMTLERWWSFARALRATGLKRINGDILVDDTAFSLPPEDPGEFDGRPNREYNVVPDALMVNFQSVEFTVVPDAGARRVEVVANPAPANLVIENRVRFAAGRCRGAAGRVDFKVASASWDQGGTPLFSLGRCRRTARNAALPGCCCGRPRMPSALSSNCGGNWAASSQARCASGRRPRMRERFSASTP